MAIEDPDVAALLEAIDEAGTNLRLVAVVCLQASPLLVSVNGVGSVPAEAMAGSSFALNETGRALWSPPSMPVCFKVT